MREITEIEWEFRWRLMPGEEYLGKV